MPNFSTSESRTIICPRRRKSPASVARLFAVGRELLRQIRNVVDRLSLSPFVLASFNFAGQPTELNELDQKNAEREAMRASSCRHLES